MSQPANNVGVTNQIKRHGLILKIRHQSMLEFRIWGFLEKDVERLDYHGGRRVIGSRIVLRYVDFGITATT
jgi:hypothetical protein